MMTYSGGVVLTLMEEEVNTMKDHVDTGASLIRLPLGNLGHFGLK